MYPIVVTRNIEKSRHVLGASSAWYIWLPHANDDFMSSTGKGGAEFALTSVNVSKTNDSTRCYRSFPNTPGVLGHPGNIQGVRVRPGLDYTCCEIPTVYALRRQLLFPFFSLSK